MLNFIQSAYNSISKTAPVKGNSLSKKNLQNLLDSFDYPVFTVDAKLRYTSFNLVHASTMKQLYNATIKLNHPILNYFTVEADRISAEKNLSEALKGELVVNEAFSGESERSRVYFEVTHKPIFNKNNVVTGVAVAAREVTRLKKVEEKLTETLINYYSIAQNSPLAVIVMDKEGKVNFWNTSAESIFGWKSTEVLGISSPFLLPDKVEEYKNVRARILEGESISNFETVRKHKNGSLVHVNFTASPYRDKDGQITGILAVIEDITDRKEAVEKLRMSEQKLKLFVEFAPAAIAMFDTEMRYIAVSRRYIQDFRLGTTDIIGRSHYEIFPEITDEIKAIHQRCLKGATEKSDESCFTRADGTMDWLRWEVLPWHEKEDKVGGILLFTELITQRIAIEKALKASEERYRIISENSADVIWLMDPVEGKFTYVSPSVEKLRGYTAEEVMAQPVSKSLAPESLKMVSTSLETTLKDFIAQGHGTQSFVNEVDQPRKDGTIVHTEVTTTYFFNQQNKVEIIGVSRDITERKLAETKLRESEARFSKIFQASPVGINIFSLKDGNSINVNDTFLLLTGYSREEIVGHTSAELNLFVNPETRQDWMKSLNKKTGVYNQDAAIRRKNGEIRNALASIDVIDINGESMGLVIVTDITERKKAERQLQESEIRFRTTLDSMMEGCQILDHDLSYIYINNAAEKHNRRPKEELLGNLYTEMWPGITETMVYQTIELCLKDQEAQHIENNFVYPNGSSAWFELSIQPIPEGVFILSMDVTERKKAEQELYELYLQLEEKVAERTAELSDLYNNAPCGYHSLDPVGKFELINDTELEWLGYKREELVDKVNVLDILTEKSQLTFKENFPRFKATGKLSRSGNGICTKR
jgi:PAS domain S-box-containing protein